MTAQKCRAESQGIFCAVSARFLRGFCAACHRWHDAGTPPTGAPEMPSPAPDVVSALQRSASLHLTAVEHYATLGEHVARWGYSKLGERWRSDAAEEREHLQTVAARLEFYDQGVNLQHDPAFWPRHDVPGQLSASLALENAAAAAERANITTSRAAGDEQSALVFSSLLEGSEDSIRQLEADLEVIRQVGLDNWLANLI